MVQLQRIGKDKVINHHHDVPYKVLNKSYTFGDENSGNKIIHGDNLEALKSLLPQYEGKIDCIYIDPPYNTGNEGRVYNDNVNDPRIKKWLNEVVGKEGEDLSRHDKWLCMMYPRLKLLHKLLSENGVIFISLDDNETKYLRLVMDEIFGTSCFVHELIWKNKYGPGALTKGVGNVHEYIICYSKEPIKSVFAPLSEDDIKKYKNKDNNYETRGGYITQPLATRSKDDRPNLVYPLYYNGEEIRPDKQWIWEKNRLFKAIEKDEVVFNKESGKRSVRFKQYLRDENGVMRLGKPISILVGPYNQDGSKEIESLFGERIFNNPKPKELIKYLFSFVFNDKPNNNGIFLDSFAGSGTTAHAVLDLNKQDGGNRKFILVELGDYAENITAERVKRVIKGYGEGDKKVEGTGGGFDFYELGEPLFIDSETLNENAGEDVLRDYIRYSETKSEIKKNNLNNKYYLGTNFDTDYYFYYEKEKITELNYDFLANIKKEKNHGLIIYADICSLSDEFMKKNNIVFKKIPRDISQF